MQMGCRGWTNLGGGGQLLVPSAAAWRLKDSAVRADDDVCATRA
jgi:hypothetical protein